MDKAEVNLVGRLTRNPVFFGAGNTRRALFAVAVNRGRDEKKKTTFIDCIAWGKIADVVEQQEAAKGTTVMVHGSLMTDRYTKKDEEGNPQQVTKLQVNVDTFMVGSGASEYRANESSSADDGESVDVGGGDDLPF